MFNFVGIDCCQPSAVYHCHANWSRDQSLWRKLLGMQTVETVKPPPPLYNSPLPAKIGLKTIEKYIKKKHLKLVSLYNNP